MGLIVPKFQSSAVARNRLRRRLLEIWRRTVQRNQGGRDLVIKTRREAYAASFEELKAEVVGFAERWFGPGSGDRGQGSGNP